MPLWPEASIPEEYPVHAACGDSVLQHLMFLVTVWRGKSAPLTDLVKAGCEQERGLGEHGPDLALR